jgi:hypothetical protein
MKRAILAFILLLAGGTGFFALKAVAHRAGEQLRASQSDWSVQTQRLAEMEAEVTALTAKIRELNRDLQAQGPAPASDLAGLLDTNRLAGLTPEAWEKLRAELGLSWHSSAEWILLSKTTLATVRMNALKGSHLTEAACGALAITPEERRRLNDAFAATCQEFTTWAKTSLQREATNGEMLVRFTIPPNPDLAVGLSNKLASAVMATLGQQRAEFLERYAQEWYQIELGGLVTMTNTLTVSRETAGYETPQLHFDFSVKGGPGQGSRSQSDKSIRICATFRTHSKAFSRAAGAKWRNARISSCRKNH